MEPFDRLALVLHPEDNIAIARRALHARTELAEFTLADDIPAGHKFAIAPIAPGAVVRRYGYSIGRATQPILPGQWVHTHNLSADRPDEPYSYRVVEPLMIQSARETFLGYRRADGRVGTRNHIAVIATVNCSAQVARQIARAFAADRLRAFPNVDGVIPIVHSGGCSFTPGGLTQRYLQRSLVGVAAHPNVGACLFIGLGCEANQIGDYRDVGPGLVIQEQGGFRRTVAAGIQAVEELLPRVNACRRTAQPVSELNLALQCGGSDSWSGVTANPLLGRVVDDLVSQGSTGVLAETPEIFGAEHLLTERVVSFEVGEKLIERFKWWSENAVRLGFAVDNNPTPGNKAGGLTTIFEKSLGAVAKGGRTPLGGVYEYAERVTNRGLVLMDTPGNDAISVTGQVAGGCNLIVFTTGRGSVLGSPIAPCVKVASNLALAASMPEDMDFDAGQLAEGGSMERAAAELRELLIRVASGRRTRSEENEQGESEFAPWQVGSAV